MHAIAADGKHICGPMEVRAYAADLAVGAEVRRIGLGYPHHRAVQHIRQSDETDFRKLAGSKVYEGMVAHCPQVVAFSAEVLEPEPYCGWVGDQRRAPVVEYLQATEFHIRFLHVDPVVGRHAVGSTYAPSCLHAPHEKPHGHEVAVR